MATLEQLQRIRLILSILIIINTIVTILLIVLVDEFFWWIICFCIYFVLVIALFVTNVRIRRILIQQMGVVGVVPVVVMAPNPGRQPSAPPPGFVTTTPGLPPGYSPTAATTVNDPPPPYSQAGLWTTQQSGTGLGQPSAYSQSAFSQPPPAGSQPFAAFNEPGQNSYWNPAQTS